MHLGDEELGVFSDIFGCAILVMPTDEDAFPVVHGDGPIGFEAEKPYVAKQVLRTNSGTPKSQKTLVFDTQQRGGALP